ncbi:yugH [Symbiodinium necroappetens]|uniref:YugH protein n=1 Tax=Symbiodinium necroappetens TaxID=1628268 RepID=A0A812VZJ3_9DINO|nr:yugH [Symbiodinium necroappetens]
MVNSSVLASRCGDVDVSGIRRVFHLGAKLKDPINLSIGQPDFPVPDAVKEAAQDAIANDHNGYTLTQGIPPLVRRIREHLGADLGWDAGNEDVGVVVTSGTSGALYLLNLALLEPGAEIIIPDPYFVAYPHMATICGGRAVRCDTYPDFRMTAERVAPLITENTRAVLLNSPGNPTGVVMTGEEVDELARLCADKGVLLISDEIYDEFVYSDARNDEGKCPSPCRLPGAHETQCVIRGFGKTYGCTGWRMGYIAGPTWLTDQVAKFQQYTYVCAPAPLQHGCLATFDADISSIVSNYETRRDMVLEKLGGATEVFKPGGAFYCFAKVPEHLGMTGQQFCERCVEENLLVIPGGVFSDRDTHFRLSFAASEDRLARGLEILVRLMSRPGS